MNPKLCLDMEIDYTLILRNFSGSQIRMYDETSMVLSCSLRLSGSLSWLSLNEKRQWQNRCDREIKHYPHLLRVGICIYKSYPRLCLACKGPNILWRQQYLCNLLCCQEFESFSLDVINKQSGTHGKPDCTSQHSDLCNWTHCDSCGYVSKETLVIWQEIW